MEGNWNNFEFKIIQSPADIERVMEYLLKSYFKEELFNRLIGVCEAFEKDLEDTYRFRILLQHHLTFAAIDVSNGKVRFFLDSSFIQKYFQKSLI